MTLTFLISVGIVSSLLSISKETFRGCLCSCDGSLLMNINEALIALIVRLTQRSNTSSRQMILGDFEFVVEYK